MTNFKQKWDASCMSALSGGDQWQTFLHSHRNRYCIDWSIRPQLERLNIMKVRQSDTLFFYYGCGDFTARNGESVRRERKESALMGGSGEDGDHVRKDLWLSVRQGCRRGRIRWTMHGGGGS